MMTMSLIVIILVKMQLIGWKDGNSGLLVDRDQIKCLQTLSEINDEADSIYELYADPRRLTESGSVWKERVLKPDRIDLQRDLKVVIERIEKSKDPTLLKG
ncbi:putative calmodulin calcium-dependent NAD kinase NADKc [Helianthus debilis subsp. tardiflorus]